MLFAVALAVGLIAYNTVTNLRWPGDRWYVPRNLTVAGGLLVLARTQGLGWEDLGLAPAAIPAGWRWGWGVVLGVVLVMSVGLALAPRVRWIERLLEDRRADLSDRELAWQTLVRIPLGTAAFEEVAFRGVLLAILLDGVDTMAAVVLSSVAFGLWHVGPTLAAFDANDAERRTGPVVIAVVATTAAGLGLSWLRLVAGLLAPVIVHWAANAFGLLAAALQRRS